MSSVIFIHFSVLQTVIVVSIVVSNPLSIPWCLRPSLSTKERLDSKNICADDGNELNQLFKEEEYSVTICCWIANDAAISAILIIIIKLIEVNPLHYFRFFSSSSSLLSFLPAPSRGVFGNILPILKLYYKRNRLLPGERAMKEALLSGLNCCNGSVYSKWNCSWTKWRDLIK